MGAASNTALVTSANPSPVGQPVTFTATVTPVIPDPTIPTGTVLFKDGGAPIQTRPLDGSGVATCTISSLGVGNHSITGEYSGDGVYDPSTSNTVSQDISIGDVTVAVFAPSWTWFWGQDNVDLSVTVGAAGGGALVPTGTVNILIDGVLYTSGPLVGGEFDVLLPDTTVALGAHTVEAVYSGDSNFNSGNVSQPVTVRPNSDLIFVVSVPGTNAGPQITQSNEGDLVRLVALIGAFRQGHLDNSVPPTGTISFYDGAALLGVVAVTTDASFPIYGVGAYLETSSLSVGIHTLSAVYSGDSSPLTENTTTSNFRVISTTPEPEPEPPPTPPPTPPEPSPGGDIPPAPPTIPPRQSCPERIDCECQDSPILNLSSERIDFPGFFCMSFSQQTPPLGTQFGETTCVAVGVSTISQEEACLQGALNGLYCITNTWQPPTLPPPPLPPPIDPPDGTFGNTAQTASTTCPTGQVVSFTVPANTFIANTQEEADAIALDFAIAYADLLALSTPGCTANPNPPPPPPQIFLNTSISCQAFCPDGLAFSYTVHAGTFGAFTQVQANLMAYTYACRQAVLHKVCLSALSPSSCCLGVNTTLTISATGNFITGNANLWSITSGAVPPGMTFSPIGIGGTTAHITGTPTVGGSYSFTVRISLLSGDYMEKTYTLCVTELLPVLLPDATPNVAYFQPMSLNCGTPSNWRLVTGSLPPGVTLGNTFGTLSGTPSAVGTYTFTIAVDVT